MKVSYTKTASQIKVALWVYFALLLLEGVLRKWILPQYSDVLFVIRDPIAIVAYVLAIRARVFPARPAIFVLFVIMVLSLAFAVGADAPLLVTFFGLRTNFLHVPLIFVIEHVLDREDVVRFGQSILVGSVLICGLMLLQFNADPDHWLNVGVGGQEGGQLRGAMGKIRPAGPFSFITGTVVFFSLATAFVCHGWLQGRTYSKLLLVVATVAIIIAVPISISRALMLEIAVVLTFCAIASVRNPRHLPKLVGPIVVIAVFLAFAADTIYIQAFVSRWDDGIMRGSTASSAILGRIVEMLMEPFSIAADTPITGHGIGVGTVAAARLITGKQQFLLGESELTRIVLELGPLLGFAFIAWRIWLIVTMIRRSWNLVHHGGDVLPWMLVGGTMLNIVVGQWGQATQLGFAVFGAGLTLAAFRDNSADLENRDDSEPVAVE